MSLLLFYKLAPDLSDSGTATIVLTPSAADEHRCPTGYGDHTTYGSHLPYIGCEVPAPSDAGTATITVLGSSAETIVDRGTATCALVPSGAEVLVDRGAGAFALVPSGAEVGADRGSANLELPARGAETIVASGTSLLVLATGETIADSGTSTIRLVASGRQRTSGGQVVTGGGLPRFELPEPIRRRGRVRLRLEGEARESVVATGRASLGVAGGGPARLEDAGTARPGLSVGGTGQIAAQGRTAARFYIARGWAVAEDGTGAFGVTGTGRERTEWTLEAEDELILLGV